MIWRARKLRLNWQKFILKFKASWKKVLGLVLGLLLVWGLGRGIVFWRKQNLPKTGFSLGFGNQVGWVMKFDRSVGQLVALRLPSNLLVPVVGGRGRYPLFGLDSLVEVGTAPELKAKSVGLLFRTDLVGWEKEDFGEWEKKKVKKQLTRFGWDCFWVGGTANLTAIDCARIWSFSRRLSVKKVELIDLERTDWVKEVAYAQQPAFELMIDYYDQPLDWWEDIRFKKPGLTFGVANSTSFGGLAGVVAGYLEHWGGSVVKIGDWSEPVDRCQLRVKPGSVKKLRYALEKIQTVFDCEVVEGGLGEYMVDVLLVAGDQLGEYAREVVR